MDFENFPCDRCGLCCEHLPNIELYQDLNNGQGVCKYFDISTRLCKIYDKRPQKCNINSEYVWFEHLMSYEEYIKLNINACKKLKEEYLCHYHLF